MQCRTNEGCTYDTLVEFILVEYLDTLLYKVELVTDLCIGDAVVYIHSQL